VDLLCWFNALDEWKGRTQGEGSPPLYIDCFHFLCKRLEELFCESFPTSPPKRKIVCGRRAIRPQIPTSYFLKRQLGFDWLPGPHPSSGVREGDRLSLAWPKTELPAIGRWLQGRTPAFRENEAAHVGNPRVLGYRVSKLLAGQWSLLQHMWNSQEKGVLLCS
jgi:hypothetical protein